MFKYTRLSIYLALLLTFLPAVSHASPEANRILSLVDYIGGDYKNAVQNGAVISTDEYNEMQEFTAGAISYFDKLKSVEGDRANIEQDLDSLKIKIDNYAGVKEVENLANQIKNKIIIEFDIQPYPQSSPSYEMGKELYTRNCAACHGNYGAGDGTIAEGLNPPPASFTDIQAVGGLSPFKVFNTVRFGIDGTAMPAFPGLRDGDKWDIAFYTLSLGYKPQNLSFTANLKNSLPPELTDYKYIAGKSNDELTAIIAKHLDEESKIAGAIAYIRSPEQEPATSENKSIAFTRSMLDSALTLYGEGNKEQAYTTAIEGYLEGYENVEPELAIKDKNFAFALETKLGKFRNAIKQEKPLAELVALNTEIQTDLESAAAMLNQKESASGYLAFVNSFSIIVREGLEAILIIAAIIAFLGAANSRHLIKYIHLGWISALVAGFFTWLLAKTVIHISGAQREVIEGVTSLLAAAVLFYVSYWLITKIEVKKWKQYIHGKLEKALTKKSVIALASVSFFAVYREAFETVLFYQALFHSESATSSIIWGIVAGAIVLVALCFVIFKLAYKIPLKYFFSVTSVFLYLLSFILLGKGIRELQEAGMIDVTPVVFLPQIDVLGVYPTVETALPQGLLLLAFFFGFVWIAYVTHEREKKELAVSISRIADDMKTMSTAFDHIKGHIIEWRRCEEIDLEAEELDRQIHDVIDHVDELENKIGDFYNVVSKTNDPVTKTH